MADVVFEYIFFITFDEVIFDGRISKLINEIKLISKLMKKFTMKNKVICLSKVNKTSIHFSLGIFVNMFVLVNSFVKFKSRLWRCSDLKCSLSLPPYFHILCPQLILKRTPIQMTTDCVSNPARKNYRVMQR